MFRRVVSAGLPALACLLFLGCGGDKSHRVSGRVSFKGQPVPAGKIYFIPDGAKGNAGATGYADIRDGRYDTDAGGGQGCVGGPVIVVIEGTDPGAPPDRAKGDKSQDVSAKLLFARYEVREELPQEDATRDVDVPASAARPPQPKAGGRSAP